MRTAELISTGSELLNGRTINSHARTLSLHLRSVGVELARDTTIPDDAGSITSVLQEALKRGDLVFLSGGLGPTSDDITRDTIAEWLGRDVVMDETACENIRAKCREHGLPLSPARERQALVVDGAKVLQNTVGAAPGELIEVDGKWIFLLPGPPSEFEAVLVEQVLPRLMAQIDAPQPPAERIFMLCEMPEADSITLFGDVEFPPPGVNVAYCATPGRLEMRLTSERNSDEDLDAAAEVLRQVMGSHIFAETRTCMEEVVGRLLKSRGATVATAESCTGGLVGHRLTSVGGSSAYYLGGVISYANQIKIDALGVESATLTEEGAVSAAVAQQMAAGVRARFNADFGIATTGIAGPTGGSPEKPVGLVYIAVADEAGTFVREYRLGSGRARVKHVSSQRALNVLRLRLLGML